MASGQLEKLQFTFYPDPKILAPSGVYLPMYNPTSFSVSHTSSYDPGVKPQTGDYTKKFNYVNPRTLSLELFFDGTGASPSSGGAEGLLSGLVPIPTINTVDIQIKAFLNMAYKVDNDEHKPQTMSIVWGSFFMFGVLASANVTYTMFSPNGRPIRAKLSLSIQESLPEALVAKEFKLFSPDLSKSVTVNEGDTLPLLCDKIYKDSTLYTQIAKVNNLKNYRKLKQGMELLFPPIDNLA